MTHSGKTQVQIGWGHTPKLIHVPPHTTIVNQPESHGREIDSNAIRSALEHPIGSRPLSERLATCKRVCVLWPDESRRDLSGLLRPILAEVLSSHSTSHGIAAGKHPFFEPPSGMWRHDARSKSLIHCGYTRQGTPVSYPPEVLDSDLVIAVGEIRPHYFAGYAGGAKTVFPGVAGEDGIWKNHQMKSLPGSQLGQVEGNPCRADMEDAAHLVGHIFIINVVRDHSERPVEITCGHPIWAHRAGVAKARPYFERSFSQQFQTVIVSDAYPVSQSLYQACKMLPVAGRILRPGGTIILCAECAHGVEPVKVVNQAIYQLGCVPKLPQDHRVYLVSSLDADSVRNTFAQFSPDVESLLAEVQGAELAVLPYATNVIPIVNKGVNL